MRFDADAYLAALPRPTLTLGGETFIGCHLAADVQAQHLQRLEALRAGTLSDAETRHAVRALLAACFPDPVAPTPAHPWWAVWRRRPAALTVADLVEALPLPAQLEAFAHCVSVLVQGVVPPESRRADPPTPDG